MPALSKKQQKFMGIVRSIQKGEQPASKFNKDAQDVAKDMKKTDVKKFASTKHKGLPMKKEILGKLCLLYTSPSPRDLSTSRMPSSA